MKLVALFSMALLFASCEENIKPNTEPQDVKTVLDTLNTSTSEDVIKLQKINDSLSAKIEEIEQDEAIALEISNQAEENAFFDQYEGKHALTLQWIGWEKPGEIEFTLASEGEFDVHGSQENAAGDFVKIDGTVLLNGENELSFNGKIITKVSHNNGGEPCIKDGAYTFKATGKRKYWRLQQMDNCEGGNLVDYVDIFWK